jgi:hypothetical protein
MPKCANQICGIGNAGLPFVGRPSVDGGARGSSCVERSSIILRQGTAADAKDIETRVFFFTFT